MKVFFDHCNFFNSMIFDKELFFLSTVQLIFKSKEIEIKHHIYIYSK